MSTLAPGDAVEIEEILKDFAAFAKSAAPGEILATTPGALYPTGLEGKAAAGLSMEDLRRLVWIADFTAVGLPDNAGRPWRPERQELASRLRRLYFEAHGENAYA